MLKFTVIPAIDLIGGKCVRLTRGDYGSEKVYSTNPIDVAKDFEAVGVRQSPRRQSWKSNSVAESSRMSP